jgi:fructose-1,6-bisphosphatase I
METGVRLDDFLHSEDQQTANGAAVAETVAALAEAGCQVAELLAAGPLIPGLSASRGELYGDTQKELDLRANALMVQALTESPVAWLASEEMEAPVRLHGAAPLAVAIDPLDGSSNIDTCAPTGTIFSIMAARAGAGAAAQFARPGTQQLAAGFLIYGSQTALVLTLGRGTRVFTWQRDSGRFIAATPPARIAAVAHEYAVNGSNHRHWPAPVRRYVEECQLGAEGPHGRDFNTRWLASVVAEAYRIIMRGGVYMYPADARPGYRQGRLRLVYEAAPLAMLVEQAGGAATDGHSRILDLAAEHVHQRVPLVFGAAHDVALIGRYHATAELHGQDPLFGARSLFRGADGQGVRA